ncbi:MAG: pectate lyase precursor [Pseudomonadota bacterium]
MTVRILAGFFLALVGVVVGAANALPAFPGAEGFGAAATGGRGGQVVKVTNLNTNGDGSLQWAVNQPGPRIIVFDVSGVIRGDVEIPHGDLTIAGQTAPGAGITINGHLHTSFGTTFGNIIIRHLRVRAPGPSSDWPPSRHDAVQLSRNQLLIFDHMDISHGIDENLDLWGGARDVTIQWSAITLPVFDGGHPDGPQHNFGLINGPEGGRISVHHNLFAHARARTPALAQGPAETINNVIYNGREGFTHHNPADGEFNIVGNFYRDGPDATLAPLWFDPENTPSSVYYVFNNYVDDPGVFEGRVDNPFQNTQFDNRYEFYCCGTAANQFTGQAFDFAAGNSGYEPVTTTDPATAYTQVLARAGAWPRDIVNRWVVEETQNRAAGWGNRRPSDWLEGLSATAPPADRDNDGMPDEWEVSRGLNPDDGTDHSTVTSTGYTAIEDYINQRASDLTGVTPPPELLGVSGSWFDPASAGRGFNIQFINNERFLIYFYGFLDSGERFWLVGDFQGEMNFEQALSVDMLEATGGAFNNFDPDAVNVTPWGTLNVSFNGCEAATATLVGPAGSETFALTKLAGVEGLRCSG